MIKGVAAGTLTLRLLRQGFPWAGNVRAGLSAPSFFETFT
jgi:hypothetical protein